MRRFQGIVLVIFLFVLAIVEYYSFTAVKFAVRNVRPNYKNIIYAVYITISIAWICMLLFMPKLSSLDINKSLRNFIVSFAMGILITKLIIAVLLFIDDFRRVFFHIISLIYGNSTTPQLVQKGMTRSEFINSLALILGGTLFSTMLYGMSNRYKYHVNKIKLKFAHLPNAFKGLRVIQISDIHSGSFNNTHAVQKGIDMIMAQKADIILFTGDLVNNKSDEMYEYIKLFKQLKAPMGVYSILGNHDYGDYAKWDTDEAKIKNLEELKTIHQELGWRLLLDEHISLEKNGEKIALIGVQNISFKNQFHSYGNLAKAYENTADFPFKILMSHDPTHWDGEINTKYKDIDLTLSGHTHGFQFGVEIPWLKWSPAQYIYKQWAGLYQKDNQYIYVNRGFGFLGYPGRVGILPEITLLTFNEA